MYNQNKTSKLTQHQKKIKNDILSLKQGLQQALPKLQLFQTNKYTLQQIVSKLQEASKYTNIQVSNNNCNLIYLQQITQQTLDQLNKISQMSDSSFQQWYILSKQDTVLKNSMYQSSQNVNYFDLIYQKQQQNSQLDQIDEDSIQESDDEDEDEDEDQSMNFQSLALKIQLQILEQCLQDFTWIQHLQQYQNKNQQQPKPQQAPKPQFQIPTYKKGQTIYRSQHDPTKMIVDNSQYKIETPLPQFFKSKYSIPIIVKHPQLTQDVEFSISKDVDIETVWDKVQEIVKVKKFNLLWFQEPQLNDKKHLRYEPLSKLEIQNDRLEFSIVTTQQPHFVVDYKTDKEFSYYYELKVNNEIFKIAGDGISFLEKTKGYILISQVYKDYELMDKQTLRFSKVQSIRICHPSNKIYTDIKGQKKDQIFAERFVQNLQELQFLDNSSYVQITFNYHEGSIYKYKNQYMIKKDMPCYLLPSFYKFKQHSFNPEQSIYFDGFDYNPNQLIQSQQNIDINNTARIQENPNVLQAEVRICGGDIFQMNVQAQQYKNYIQLDLTTLKSKLINDFGQGSIYRGSIQINDLQSFTIPNINQAVFYYYQQQQINDNVIIINFVINSKIYQYPFYQNNTVTNILYLCCKLVQNSNLSAHFVINYKDLNLFEIDENQKLSDLKMIDQDYISIFYLSGHKSPSFYSKYMSFNQQYTIDEIINDMETNQQEVITLSKQKAEMIKSIKSKFNQLTEGEIFSIILYTSQFIHSDLNANLGATKVFQGDEHTASYSKMITSMLTGLSKLVQYIGKVYRGIRQKVDAEKVRIGKFICFQSYVSTSEEKNVAFEFAKNEDNSLGTFFEINTLSGVQISQLSVFQLEKEILIPPYTWFKVTDAQYIQEYNIQYIALSEVPTPKSFKVALICSEINDINNKLRQICQQKGYTCTQICNWQDLDLSFQRFQHFYNNLAPNNLLIIINATKELDKNYLEVLFTKYKYKREVFYYSQNNYDYNNNYVGLIRRFYDNKNINQNYCEYTNDEFVNFILNYYQIPLKYLDLTYNRIWIAGKGKKGGLEYYYPHQFQGIGVKIKNINCFSNDYCVAYVGIQFDKLINYLNQYPNTKYTMTHLGETICQIPNLYFTNNAQEAQFMTQPQVLGNKQFYLVLQVRLFIKSIQIFNQLSQTHQIYTCQESEYIQIQRILVQTV